MTLYRAATVRERLPGDLNYNWETAPSRSRLGRLAVVVTTAMRIDTLMK
jgi:hypothetical protein